MTMEVRVDIDRLLEFLDQEAGIYGNIGEDDTIVSVRMAYGGPGGL